MDDNFLKSSYFYIIDLEEVGLPLEEYASLREFFVHTLKEGSRTIDSDPYCLVNGNGILGDMFYILFTLLQCQN